MGHTGVSIGTIYPPQALALQNIEPYFNLIQPGTMEKGENKLNLAVLLGQPVFDQQVTPGR